MSKQKHNLMPPVRTVVLGGNPLQLKMDFAAMYTYERISGGKNLYSALQQYSDDGPIYTVTAQLLYALSASSRRAAGVGDLSFEGFLEMLPDGSPTEYQRLTQMAMEVITGTLGLGGEASGNGQAPSA